MRRLWLSLGTALFFGLFLGGCTAQLAQADRDLLNQALAASKSAATSAERAEAAADRAEDWARSADRSAAQARQSAAEAKKAFEMGLTK